MSRVPGGGLSPIRVEAKAFSDARFALLAAASGGRLVDHDHARSKVEYLWSECTTVGCHYLPAWYVAHRLGAPADALIAAGLGEWAGEDAETTEALRGMLISGADCRLVRVRGCDGRIEWLASKRAGGEARAAAATRVGGRFARPPAGHQQATSRPPAHLVQPAQHQQATSTPGAIHQQLTSMPPACHQPLSPSLSDLGAGAPRTPSTPPVPDHTSREPQGSGTGLGADLGGGAMAAAALALAVPPAKPKRQPRAKAVKGPLPADWRHTSDHATLAAELRLDARHEAEAFRDHARANGRQQVDWDAAFRSWLRNTAKWDRQRTAGQPQPLSQPPLRAPTLGPAAPVAPDFPFLGWSLPPEPPDPKTGHLEPVRASGEALETVPVAAQEVG